MLFKKSIFSHIFKKDNMYCAYNALTMECIYISEKSYKNIEQLFSKKYISKNEFPQKIFNKLAAIDFFIPLNANEKDYILHNKNLFQKKQNIRVMVLHTTDFCNLKCKYCYVEDNLPKCYIRKNMTVEIIKAAIDKFVNLIIKYTPKDPTIIFYGGEPLLNWNVILNGLEYIDEYYSNIKIKKSLITNATLITEEIATQLKKHNVDLGISVDGGKMHNDTNRIYALNNRSVFDDVKKALKILSDNDVEVGASCVLTKENTSKCIEIVKELVDTLQFKKIGFNHVSVLSSSQQYDPKYEDMYAQSLLNIADFLISQRPEVYEQKVGDKLTSFLSKEITRTSCTACGEQMNVNTRGMIGICQGMATKGDMYLNSVFDVDYDPNQDETFLQWSKRTPYFIDECLKCCALSTCGAGCPKNAQVLTGNPLNKDDSFCHFSILAQKWMIWKKFTLFKDEIEIL